MLIDRLHRHTELVLAIGVAVEALFLLFGLSFYNLFSPLFDAPGPLYSSAIVVLGTYLTGIIVGFLVSNKKHAAPYGFLSALIPSLLFSLIIFRYASGPPLVLLIPIFILLVFDLAAAVGGVIGSLIKTKAFFAATVTVLLLTSLIFSGGLIAMPTRQSGDLIVKRACLHYGMPRALQYLKDFPRAFVYDSAGSSSLS